MNDDLISRKALKKVITANHYLLSAKHNSTDYGMFTTGIIEAIDNAPTIEVRDNFDVGYVQGLEDGRKEKTHGDWIPVSERFPDNETEVLIQCSQSMMVGYHIFDYTIYPFGHEDLNETGWYDSIDDYICGDDEVIAWMPLPEPYKEEENER